MNIENIIKRLQDVDKLKMVLFSNKQRKAFELLPKPGIAVKQNFEQNCLLTMDLIAKPHKKRYKKKSSKNLEFLLNGDPINTRMLEIMQTTIKKELEQNKESFFNYNYYIHILFKIEQQNDDPPSSRSKNLVTSQHMNRS